MSESLNHEQAYELLPWYLNGTLDGAERSLVQAHVSTCLICHRELKAERRLSELVASSAMVDPSAEASFDRLVSGLSAHRSRGGISGSVLGRWIRSACFPPRLAVALLASLALAGILWVALPRLLTPQSPEFVTLAGNARSGNHLDVVFADQVTEPQMRALLGELDGTIVAGPSEIGRYTIRLNDPRIGHEQLAMIIRTMNEDERIQFAGPALTQEPTP